MSSCVTPTTPYNPCLWRAGIYKRLALQLDRFGRNAAAYKKPVACHTYLTLNIGWDLGCSQLWLRPEPDGAAIAAGWSYGEQSLCLRR
jgi:hypothetical protein